MTLYDPEWQRRATSPGWDPVTEIATAAREQAIGALTYALARPSALALADEIEKTLLAQARLEVVPYQQAIDDARAELADEQRSLAAQIADFWNQRVKSTNPADSSRAPSGESERVQQLRVRLQNAETKGWPAINKVRILQTHIGNLRQCPKPSEQTLALIAAAAEATR